jgi:glucokinase
VSDTVPPAGEVRAGLDLGGTGVRIVVAGGGRVLGREMLATAEAGAGTVTERVERLAACVRRAVPGGARLVAAGIGASGPITPDWSEITNPDTLPRFSGFPLPALLAAALGVPVRLDNDAVTAALGEYHFGAGRGSARLLMVTIGTGVGVALLDRGLPWRTVTGQHPDAGHLPVFGDAERCYCGLTGCFEQHASRLALERRLAAVASAEARPAPEPGCAPGPGCAPEPESSLSDSPAVDTALDEYGRDLGRGLEALEIVFGPDRIVVGGAASRWFGRFEAAVRAGMVRSPGYAGVAQVVQASLGDLAGALGATMLADAPSSSPVPARVD